MVDNDIKFILLLFPENWNETSFRIYPESVLTSRYEFELEPSWNEFTTKLVDCSDLF